MAFNLTENILNNVKTSLKPKGLVMKELKWKYLVRGAVRGKNLLMTGPAGCGKTSIWQTLLGCDNLGQQKKVAIAEPVNPKAVTNEELFGYMTLSKDWKDGCLSIVMIPSINIA